MRVLPCLLIFLGLAAAADWKDSKFPDWNEETVLRVLTDSPWTHRKTVQLEWKERQQRQITYKDIPGADHLPATQVGSPVGGIGGKPSSLQDKADLLIRWASALPVRHATALYKLRQDKLDPSKLNALIGAPESDYVVEIFGIPAELAHSGGGMVETIAKDSAYLRLRSGRTLRPNRVEANVQALTMTVRIHFSRAKPIPADEKEMEFYANLQVFSVREKFKLGSMVYQGNLEL